MFSQTLTGVISGVIVAIFWVGYGNWVQGRVQKIRVLRGLKSEIGDNRELYNFLIDHVSSDLEAEEKELHNVPMMEQFSKEAYENAKSSGAMADLPTDLQETLFNHYDSLGFANRQIGGRERWKIDGQSEENYQEMARRLDRAILGTLIYLNPNRLDEIDKSKIQKLSENYSEEDFAIVTGEKEPETRIDFQHLRNNIDANLKQYTVLGKLV